jgi:CubicO group peptidase (beta-lactamase class C family)
MHTSGVVNFTDLPEYNEIKNSSIVNIQDIITLFKNKPLGFKPGSQYEYSNSGYILLSHIIEKVSKKTYADYINENVFKPLNMNNSGYDQSELTLENRASGYILFSEKNSFESKEISIHKASCLNMQIPLGAGGLYSTVEDLFIWSQLLHSGDKAVSALIDSTIFMNNDPKKASSMSYGYGIIVDTDYSTSHKKIIFHNGEIDGFSSIMMQIVDENITIIILSNFEHADINTIANNIAGIILCK